MLGYFLSLSSVLGARQGFFTKLAGFFMIVYLFGSKSYLLFKFHCFLLYNFLVCENHVECLAAFFFRACIYKSDQNLQTNQFLLVSTES